MTDNTKNRPTHRISFARITGSDENGQDQLGPKREIGSVWPRKNAKSNIIRLDFVPIELTQHQGVLFLEAITSKDDGGAS